MITLKGDDLFKNKTRAAKDAVLIKLRQAGAGRINFDLSGQGESDAERVIMPLACMTKQPVTRLDNTLPVDTALHILSFLAPKPKPEMLPAIKQGFADTCKRIESRPSIIESSLREANHGWHGFIGNQLMQAIQWASIALGAVILLSCSGAGMLILGSALIVAGVAGLAMRYLSTNAELAINNTIDLSSARP